VRLNGEVLSPPTISERVVAVRTVDGKLHGLAPQDGHELWNQEQQVPRLSLRGTSRPVVVGDLALCGFDNGKVLAVNMNDGSLQWEATIAPPHGRTELERLVDVDSAVKVVGQDVYAVGFQGRIAMLALDTGQIWWSHDASSYRGMGVDDETLYMASADGEIIALRRRTGAELWRQKALLHRGLSAIAVSDDAIITADFQGYVHWLDKASGALAARIQSGKVRVSNPPVVAGNLVLVMNDKGRITAFRATPLKTASAAKEPAPATAPAAAPAAETAPAPAPGDTTGVPPASPPDLPPAPDKKTIPENTPMTPEERK
jgi:outer membrane protein assembly factor BamB